jgi:type IV secretory pathway TrbF-like protein
VIAVARQPPSGQTAAIGRNVDDPRAKNVNIRQHLSTFFDKAAPERGMARADMIGG